MIVRRLKTLCIEIKMRKKPRLAQPMKGSSTLNRSTNGASPGSPFSSQCTEYIQHGVLQHMMCSTKRNVDAEKVHASLTVGVAKRRNKRSENCRPARTGKVGCDLRLYCKKEGNQCTYSRPPIFCETPLPIWPSLFSVGRLRICTFQDICNGGFDSFSLGISRDPPSKG